MNAQIMSGEKSTLFSQFNFFGSPSSSNANKIEDDNNLLDVEGKVKTRLLSMWNNVKFGK